MKIHYGIIIIMCCLLNACQPASQNPRIYDSGISQELAELRKQEINELKYDLRLSIPKQKSMPVEGEIHVRFRLNKAQEVILDFREEADKIKEVSANGLRHLMNSVTNILFCRRIQHRKERTTYISALLPAISL